MVDGAALEKRCAMSTVGSNPTLSATFDIGLLPSSPPGAPGERSPRGLWRRTGNAVRGNPSGVRIPPSPPAPVDSLKLTDTRAAGTIGRGRARRGTSGALHPQSATAGLNSRSRSSPSDDHRARPTSRAGSHAAECREPRQVREEAAVSGELRVPWGDLAGAGRRGRLGWGAVDTGCTTSLRSIPVEDR